MENKLLLTAKLSTVAIVCFAVVGTAQEQSSDLRLHEALDHLQNARYEKADRIAKALVSRNEEPLHRAWLISAAARQRNGQYASAIEAYNAFGAYCTSTKLRNFVKERIRFCRSKLNTAIIRVAPSKRLTGKQLSQLASVGKDFIVESSEHFVVRAKNASLARLISVEAEKSLRRICGDILGGQDYPHSVDIYVWPDRQSYSQHAVNAPDWSGGHFSFSCRNGVAVRRIDLTQCDKNGRFERIMIDRILAHEMCHLVVQEYFGDAACPLMLNEGLAMLSEADVDNTRIRLAGTVLADEKKVSLLNLFAQRRHNTHDVAVFYAKSFSFVEFLHSRLSQKQFREFLTHVKDGCSIADAIQRTLYMPDNEQFISALTQAWCNRAVRHAHFLKALRKNT